MSEIDWKRRYEDLHKSHEEYKEQAGQIEQELEKELTDVQREKENLERQYEKVKDRLESLQSEIDSKSKNSGAQLSTLQDSVGELQREIRQLKEEKRKLEQEKDDLENKLRRLEVLNDDQKEKLEAALEDTVILQGELEEAQAEKDETIARLKQELQDTRSELQVVKNKVSKEKESKDDVVDSSVPPATQPRARGSPKRSDSDLASSQSLSAQARTPRNRTSSDPEEGGDTTIEGEEEAVGDQSIDDLQARVKQLEEELQDQTELNEQLREEVKEATREVLKANERIEQLTKLHEGEQKSATVPSDSEKEQVETLRGENETLAKNLKSATEDTKLLKEKIAKLELELEEAKKMSESSVKSDSSKLEAKVKENEMLQEQLQSLRSEIHTLQMKIKEISSKKEVSDELSPLPMTRPSSTSVFSPGAKPLARTLTGRSQSVSGIPLPSLVPMSPITQPPVGNSKTALTALRTSVAKLKQEMSESSTGITDIFTTMRDAITKLSTITTSAQKNLEVENQERRKLFEEIQDIKGGNIRVFCRVRPILESEKKQKDFCDVIEVTSDRQVTLVGSRLTAELSVMAGMNLTGVSAAVISAAGQVASTGTAGNSIVDKPFTFDRVFGPHSTQQECFQDVQATIFSVLLGHNVCIFAYGQTGSGKTFTMEGPEENPGIYYRSMESLFGQIEQKSPQFKYQVTTNLIEIYNEQLRDLLADIEVDGVTLLKPIDKSAKLTIRQGSEGIRGKRTYVQNATSAVVENVDQVLRILSVGGKNRAVESTALNVHSSRSHLLFLVEIQGVNQLNQDTSYGKLCLVDLAGSERVKQSESVGMRLKEATYINKSLSSLGDVMKALGTRSVGKFKKEVHIPYRNSKLTYLLQDALGGNSKTLMFVNISPASIHFSETIQSLQFAKRVSRVKLEAPIAAVENGTLAKYKTMVDELKNEIRSSKDSLSKRASKAETMVKEFEAETGILKQQVKQLQEQLKSMETLKAKETEESKEAAKNLERTLQKKLSQAEASLKEKEAAMSKLETKLKSKEKESDQKRRESGKVKEKELQEKQKEQEQMRKMKQISTESKKNEEKYDKQLKDLVDKVEQLQRKLTKQQEEAEKNKVEAEGKLNAMTVKYQASLKWYNVLETRAESAEKKSRLAVAAKKRLDQALEEAKDAQKKALKIKEKQLEAYKEKHKKLAETVRAIKKSKNRGDKDSKDIDTISISSQDLEQPATPPPDAEPSKPFASASSSGTTMNGVTSSLGSPGVLTPRRARSNTNASQVSAAGSIAEVARDSQSRARRDSQSSTRSDKAQLKRTPSGRKTPTNTSGRKMNGTSSKGAKASRIPGPKTPSQTTVLRSARIVDKETRERLKAKARSDLDAKVSARRDARALKTGIPLPTVKSPPVKNVTLVPRTPVIDSTAETPPVPSLLDSSQDFDASDKFPIETTSKTDLPVLTETNAETSAETNTETNSSEIPTLVDKVTDVSIDTTPIPLDLEEKETDGVRETPSAEHSHDSASIAGSDVGVDMTDSKGNVDLTDPKYTKARPSAIVTSQATSTTLSGTTIEEGDKKTPREKPSKKLTSRPPSVAVTSKQPKRAATSLAQRENEETKSPTGEKKPRIIKPVVIKGGQKKGSPEKVRPKSARPASRGGDRTPSKRGPALIKRAASAKQPPSTAPIPIQPLIQIPKDKIKKKDGESKKVPPPAVNKPPPFSHSLLDFNLFSEGLDSLTDLGSLLPAAGQVTTNTTSSPPESP